MDNNLTTNTMITIALAIAFGIMIATFMYDAFTEYMEVKRLNNKLSKG